MNIIPSQDLPSLLAQGYPVIDARSPEAFIDWHVPGSIYWFQHSLVQELLPQWFDPQVPFILITDNADQDIPALASAGIDNIHAVVTDGLLGYASENHPIDVIVSITPEEARIDSKFSKPHFIDIRDVEDFQAEHWPHAEWMDLKLLVDKGPGIQLQTIYFLVDEDGALSTFIISWLKHNGSHQFYLVLGGWEALKPELEKWEQEG